MKLVNALRKLRKHGFTIVEGERTQSYSDPGVICMPFEYYASRPDGREEIIIYRQDNEVLSIRVKSKTAKDDPITDYYAGVFVRSIAEAIRYYE